MRIIESLARADASVAWTVMIGAAPWIDMAGLPRATFDALFATPDVITAGVFNPTGSIAVRRRATRSRPLELRQRMRARRLAVRQLRRGRRGRRAADCGWPCSHPSRS